MTVWDGAVLLYASLGRHAPAILFELVLLTCLLVLRTLLPGSRGGKTTNDVQTGNVLGHSKQ
jgi:hypothetical protein